MKSSRYDLLTTHETKLVKDLERIAKESQTLADDIVSGRAAHYDGYAEANAIVLTSVSCAQMIHKGFDREWMEARHDHTGPVDKN